MAQSSTTRAWARGGTVLAATILLMVGIFQIFWGIGQVLSYDVWVAGPNAVYTLNNNTWGWIRIGVGIAAVLIGLGLFTGTLWARILGCAAAVASAVANFFWLPVYPLVSVVIIALDVYVIWAIANYGRRELRQDAEAAYGAYASENMQTGERWPTTNQATGRHWAGEPAKEGTGSRAAAEREQAEAMAQGARPNQPGQPGSGQSGQSGMGGQSGMSGQQ